MPSSIIYLPHGGGPLPLFNDAEHHALIQFLSSISQQLIQPKAILVISAHWEEEITTVSGAAAPDMLYDYYGFPEESYQVTYPAPGSPQLASQVADMLKQHGIKVAIDANRGFDHATFVPLKLMYPEARLPVVQLSLTKHMDPEVHINVGQAIANLAQEGILIIGSGLSFHNMHAFMTEEQNALQKSQQFDHWLNDALLNKQTSWQEKQQSLINWEHAPQAKFCHPREEHLLPLHVCFGAAKKNKLISEQVFNDTLFGCKISGFLWQ